MFEYTAAYLVCDGNAPQVGDNDSGRILLLNGNEVDDQNHSYLNSKRHKLRWDTQ